MTLINSYYLNSILILTAIAGITRIILSLKVNAKSWRRKHLVQRKKQTNNKIEIRRINTILIIIGVEYFCLILILIFWAIPIFARLIEELS